MSKELFDEICNLLKSKGYVEQYCGAINMNGTLGTNFVNDNDGSVIHVSLEMWPDEEKVACLKGEE